MVCVFCISLVLWTRLQNIKIYLSSSQLKDKQNLINFRHFFVLRTTKLFIRLEAEPKNSSKTKKSQLPSLMSSLVTSVAISAIFFTEINVFLNFYLLSQIFIRKKIQKKPELSLIYCRFLIDVIYSFDSELFLSGI